MAATVTWDCNLQVYKEKMNIDRDVCDRLSYSGSPILMMIMSSIHYFYGVAKIRNNLMYTTLLLRL